MNLTGADLRAVDLANGRFCGVEVLHESLDGEWSFIETLRHLVFATDSWVRRASVGGSVAVGFPGPAVGRDA